MSVWWSMAKYLGLKLSSSPTKTKTTPHMLSNSCMLQHTAHTLQLQLIKDEDQGREHSQNDPLFWSHKYSLWYTVNINQYYLHSKATNVSSLEYLDK